MVAAAEVKVAAAGAGAAGVGGQDGETWRTGLGSPCPGGGGWEDAWAAAVAGIWTRRAQPRSEGVSTVGTVVVGGKVAVSGSAAGGGRYGLGNVVSAVRLTGGGTGTEAADGFRSCGKVCRRDGIYMYRLAPAGKAPAEMRESNLRQVGRSGLGMYL